MSLKLLVYALDKDGYELNTPFHEGEESLKTARLEAARLLRDEELKAAGLFKVEIRNGTQVIKDYFV